MSVEAITVTKKRDAALLYAEARLGAWARWARENRNKLGLPTISLLYKAMKQRATPMRIAQRSGLTANGSETHSFRPLEVPDIPAPIREVDLVVAKLPKDLHDVIHADYFTYGPIEVRAKETRWKRARYCQLLESAKYAVFISLDSRTPSDI